MTDCRTSESETGGPPPREIRTARLLLRSFEPTDAPRVQELAGAAEVAATTLHIPHPYEDGMAEAWIAGLEERRRKGEAIVFAVELGEAGRGMSGSGPEAGSESGLLVGAVGLELDPANDQAEMGYWIGTPYWGRGFATEATAAVVRYGFEELQLNRVHAAHFALNPASGRVLEKLGMRREGCRRQHVLKWDRYVDLVLYGLLRAEYEPGRPPG